MYIFYQPNEKDKKNNYGDCVIRAISKALNCTWLEAFDLCTPFEREVQCPVSCFDLNLYKKFYSELGFKYQGISNKKGSKRPTVESFAKEHSKGTYICNVSQHQVTIVDGDWYDTWDSSDKCLYGYFEKD